MLRRFAQRHGSNAVAANAWGVSARTLAAYLAGESVPKLNFIESVAQAEGIEIADFFVDAENFRTPDDSAVQIPLRDVFASAGPGAEVVDESQNGSLTFSRTFVDAWGRSPAKVEAIHARGDSMLPTIQDGAVVLIDRAERDLIEGRVYAFRTPDGLRLKRFQRAIDGSALLVSDNRELYAPERMTPADLEALKVAGRAFWTGRMI